MRFTRSFLTSTLLLASVSATTPDNRADGVEKRSPNGVITLTKTNYHTVCPCTTALLSSPTSPSLLESNPGQYGGSASTPSDESGSGSSSGFNLNSESGSSSGSAGGSGTGSGQEYTTSTVYTAKVHTVTACPSPAKDCPVSEKTTFVTTETVIDYTTICPVTESATKTGTGTRIGEIWPTKTITGVQGEEYTTSTVYTTSVRTVTACPSSVKSCPASERSTYVTTDTIIDFTTICPVTATSTGSGSGAISTGPDHGSGSNHGSGSDDGSGSGHGSGSGNDHGHGHGHGSGSSASSRIASSNSPQPSSTPLKTSTTGTIISPHSSIQHTSSTAAFGAGSETTPGTGHSHGHGSGASSGIALSKSARPSSTPLLTSTTGTPMKPSRSVQRTGSTTVIKTVSPASPSSTLEPLALYVEPIQEKKRRQIYNSAILIGAGSITASCADADRFYLTGGHLYDESLLIAAEKDASSASFEGTGSPGPLRGTFAVTSGILSWSNSEFTNGAASFCVSGSMVLAIFNDETPSGCTPVTIAAVKYCKYLFLS